MGNMKHRIILHVGSVADTNRVHIGSHRTVSPDTDIITNLDITKHRGTWVNHDSGTKLWCAGAPVAQVIFPSVGNGFHGC